MRNIFSCIAALYILIIGGYNLNAQCSGLTQGSSFDEVSGTIDVNTTWTSDKYIVDDLIIDGAILTINAKNVKVAEDVTIYVYDEGEIIITNGTDIYGEPDGMGGFKLWQGIVVEGGGAVTMDDSQIFYARIAIQANNSGSEESVITISTSCFENNDIGIYFGPNALPDASTSLIESTEFHAPDLVDELNNELGDYGVLVYLTDHNYGI
jgi:hypothetical protein